MMGYPKRYQALLAILRDHAPNGSAQQDCTQLMWDLEATGADEKSIELAMAQVLVDVLQGNSAPWHLTSGEIEDLAKRLVHTGRIR